MTGPRSAHCPRAGNVGNDQGTWDQAGDLGSKILINREHSVTGPLKTSLCPEECFEVL